MTAYKFSSFHTVVLLSLIFIMTVKHNYLFINVAITNIYYDRQTQLSFYYIYYY